MYIHIHNMRTFALLKAPTKNLLESIETWPLMRCDYQCSLMSKLKNATAGPGQQAEGAGGGGGQGDGEGEDSVGGEHQEY